MIKYVFSFRLHDTGTTNIKLCSALNVCYYIFHSPAAIPAPDRNEIMKMLSASLEAQTLDVKKALKENFILNDLNGEEDHLVRDELWSLVGQEVTSFRSAHMSSPPPKTMSALLKSITPPEGVGLKCLADIPVDEGQELIDGDFIEPPSSSQPLTPITDASPSTSSADAPSAPTPESAFTSAPTSERIMKELPLAANSGNIHLDADAVFLNELGELMARHSYSHSKIRQYRILLQRDYFLARRQHKKCASLQSPAAPSPPSDSASAPSTCAPPSVSPSAPSADAPSAQSADAPIYSNGRYISFVRDGHDEERGMLTDVDDEACDVIVNTMKQVTGSEFYFWPVIEAMHVVPFSNIIKKWDNVPDMVTKSQSQRSSYRSSRYVFTT